jgi:hypothetical protein
MTTRALAASLLIFGVLLAGCGSASHPKSGATTPTVQTDPDVPAPPIAKVLPPNYRATKIWQANLTNGSVPETVVSAVGPPTGELNFHPATLQVLSWDDLAKRWIVLFDGQKVIAPDSYGSPQSSNSGPGYFLGITVDRKPILDPKANVTVDEVKFAPILSEDRDQLIFSATLSYGGSGLPSTLAVVDFDQGQAHIIYTWYGEGLERDWNVRENQIVARSSYWTRADSHCCPSRSYTFTVGNRKGYVTELEDQRPYLGVLVRETGAGAVAGAPLRVIDIADNSPASSALRVGDVLLDVTNAPPVESPDDVPANSIFNKVSAFDAGETARLLVRRDGADLTLPVRLGSLRDAEGLPISADDYAVDAL